MRLFQRLESEIRMRTLPARYKLDNYLYRRSVFSKTLEEIKDRHHGKPMLVIGNGPSLNKTPLGEFRAVPSIGMNKINMIFPRTEWRPSYVICTNNLVVKQNREFFCEAEIPTFIAYKARWFLPRQSWKRIQFFNLFQDEAFSLDFSQGVGQSSTVTYAALQMAYYLGANPVILFGVDHSFSFASKVNQAYIKSDAPDVNHFDPNYFGKGTVWGTPNLENSEELYAHAKRAFESNGRRILDATIGGKLGIFPKIAVEEAQMLCGIIASDAEDDRANPARFS